MLVSVAVVSLLSIATALDDCKCKSHAFKHQNYWYQIVDCPKSWKHAEEYCQHSMIDTNGSQLPGGYLVTIDSFAERRWVELVLSQTFGGIQKSFWIGGRRSRKFSSACGPWGWANGQIMNECYWHSEEPRNHHGLEACIALHKFSSWTSLQCDIPLSFLCKRSLGNDFPGGSISPSGNTRFGENRLEKFGKLGHRETFGGKPFGVKIDDLERAKNDPDLMNTIHKFNRIHKPGFNGIGPPKVVKGVLVPLDESDTSHRSNGFSRVFGKDSGRLAPTSLHN